MWIAGSRGIQFDFWNHTEHFNMDLVDVLSANGSVLAELLDETFWNDENLEGGEQDHYVTRMTGYFVAPQSGNFSFNVRSDDESVLYMSLTGDLNDTVSNLLLTRYYFNIRDIQYISL